MGSMLLLSAAFVMVSSCSTTGIVSQEAMFQINPGMSREQVVSLLGVPGSRSFRDDGEALTYCRTGFLIDSYTTVWLVRGRVVSLTTSDEPDRTPGLCTARFPAIDWGQVPPDVRIAIERVPN